MLENLGEAVLSLVADACNVERSSVDPHTSLRDLGMDSLSVLSVMSHLAITHGVELTPEEMLESLQLPRVDDVVRFMEAALARRPATQ